jgi:phage terminase large subunit GpA-like protein
MICPHCHEDARFVNDRKTTLTSLFGSVIYERAYYHCKHCHQSHIPTDNQLHVENRKMLRIEKRWLPKN